jgi:hypothetical protein
MGPAVKHDAEAELRDELRRALELLAAHLAAQRRGGRTPESDPLRGIAIDAGEAEGLVAELAAQFEQAPPEAPARDHVTGAKVVAVRAVGLWQGSGWAAAGRLGLGR